MRKRGLHVAVIPDGNRRYAKKLGKPISYGHEQGARKMEEFLDWCLSYPDIKVVSIYALSTENLKRSARELRRLWSIYKKELVKLKKSEKIKKHRVRVNIVGNEKVWRNDIRQAAHDLMRLTANYSRTVLNILLSYGGRFEIINAVQRMIEEKIKTSSVPRVFEKYLLVTQPVDLIIRTGGHRRISNLLLYQSAYSEIYFTDTLWPEFTKEEFDKIMRWFFKEERKFGR